MGAWETGNFDNDDALDWLYDLEKANGIDFVANSLTAVTGFSGDYLESPDCCIALAAAEIVAAMKGAPPKELPDAADDWLRRQSGGIDASLIASALSAIDRVQDDCELAELWQESEHHQDWLAVLAELRNRLVS